MAAEPLAFRTHIVYICCHGEFICVFFWVGCDENCKAFIDSGFKGVVGVYAALR